MSLLDPALSATLDKDKAYLAKTKTPIITVSASFKEDLKGTFGFPENESIPDVVFSRAHYSMGVALLVKAWGAPAIQEAKAWLVDPTNYVSHQDWKRIEFTETVGKTLARHNILKKFKDLVDTFGRSKLPILDSITPPLLQLTSGVERPILSLHIAAGNILVTHGKQVIQVITDPHVRDEYLTHADSKNMWFCVFDSKTKAEFLEKAAIYNKNVDPERVIVTGPPVDPRILGARQRKRAWRNGPLHLCLTTGGLGTNKEEIRSILKQLFPELKRQSSPYRLLIYAGTHEDITDMVTDLARSERLSIHPAEDTQAKVRLLYHPQIVDANELLIKYAFPWADGFISKPSGDMAYDAAAAGCFLLTLLEWGAWEHNIREVFEQKEISRQAQVENILDQLAFITNTKVTSTSWVENAMNQAFQINPLLLSGAENILKAYRKIANDQD